MTPVNRARAFYFALAAAALALITTANRLGERGLERLAGTRLIWAAELCIPSFLVCFLLYWSIRPSRPFAGPQPDTSWSRLARLGGAWLLVWLAGSAIAAGIVGHWIRYTSGLYAVLCFALIGPLQEELLYRGVLFELAERGWPQGRIWSPITASTVPFALQHFQFHGYRLSPAALLQVAFTIPMGLVFGRLRRDSGSLWPGFAVHVVTNLTGAFGGAP